MVGCYSLVFHSIIIFDILLLGLSNSSELTLTNVMCTSHNETLYSIHLCRLKAISRHKVVGNYNATMHYPVYEIVAKVQFFKKANGYKPWLYKFELDLCKYFSRAHNPVAIVFITPIRKYTNLNHTCPYEGSNIVKGFHAKYDSLPIAIPTGEYLIAIEWFFNKKRTVSTKLYFKAIEDIIKS